MTTPSAHGQAIVVIFDDLIGSSSLKNIVKHILKFTNFFVLLQPYDISTRGGHISKIIEIQRAMN